MFQRGDPPNSFIEKHINRSAGAPAPAGHFDWSVTLRRWPTLGAREKLVADVIATWAIDPATGEMDWHPPRLAAECGETPRGIRDALNRLVETGWLIRRTGDDGLPRYRLSLPIFDAAHPDFEPMARLAVLTIGAALEHLEVHDGIPREAIFAGALATIGTAIQFHHGREEAARRLRDIADQIEDPEAWAASP